MLELERRDGAEVLWIDRPPVNAADLDSLTELADAVDRLVDESDRPLVLAARGPAFSAGADLHRILEGDGDYAAAFVAGLVRAFTTLFTFPRPLVGAVTGHAIAGGAILACCCDYAVAAGGPLKIGVTELRVGVPYPLAALEIVRHAVAPERFEEVVFRAGTYGPEEARAIGFVDEVVAAGSVMDRALEVAKRLGQVPPETYALIKAAVRRPALERIEAWGAEHDAATTRGWQSDEVRAAIRSFLDRAISRSG
ncbi:MAG TPA: enoyl-CoA hydratase/isomerase family protein [Actinomycetota bacterium]|nr:enoyl-CoA hydratase/isomerase family protein [Actinomycetota bacterium]